ncbi:MAG: hypothetical protein GXO86_07770 [Chlorobi bacterium]|nr:hypothetical protein [Chlorobiota bacterium]
MKVKTILFSGLFALSHSVYSQGIYQPTQVCCDITDEILNLNVISAKNNIRGQLRKTPDNFYLYYLDQYADFINLLIAPNENKFRRFKDNYSAYREIMDDNDNDSPYYYFIKSTMQLQMGLVKLKFGDYITGINHVFRAYRNTRKNTEKFPDFYGNKKMNGLFNLILTNIPPFIRNVAKVFGVKPSNQNPIDLLEQYKTGVTGKKGLKVEADIFITLAYLLEKEPDKGFLHISSLDPAEYNNFLVKYFYGNLAYHARENEKALKVFRTIDINRTEVPFYPYYFLYGKILMNKLDPHASDYFVKFISETNGIDYLKQAHLYLAYGYLLKGEKEKYEIELTLVKKTGSDKTERDRDALCDLKSGYTPDTTLLQASFLEKGGYFTEASVKLSHYNFSHQQPVPDKLNYMLLNGNVALGLHDTISATGYYKETIAIGEKEKYFFACNAALNLGMIYESRGDLITARSYYDLCKDLYDSGYYESIIDKAEKGLARIEAGLKK